MAESINVACRIRPFNSSEVDRKDKPCVSFPPDNKNAICLGGKNFTFDHVIQPEATQLEVYEKVAKNIVSDVLNGYNGTIFAYGQTSSGKTFTMEGKLNDDTFQGIIPRIIRDIFDHIYLMESSIEFHIKVSYLEIYLDKIRDLLDINKTNLSVHEDKDRVPYVKGCTERFVLVPEDVFEIIDEGKNNRHVAVTNMNEHSSRSHSVFMVNVKQENPEIQKKLHGKLYLVDLAGSEKVAKTGAEGTVLDEAKNINKSLSALGNVINALVEGSPHVPYRDSKLTRILQESLGGNAKTTMVICCSPAMFNELETKSTLMFGMRAKTIKNNVTVNEELSADEWRRRYEKEKEKNEKLNYLLTLAKSELEIWRKGEKVDPKDWFSTNLADVDEQALKSSSETSKSIMDLSSDKTPVRTGPSVDKNVDLSPGTPVNEKSFVPTTPSFSRVADKPPRRKISGSINEDQIQALYQQLDDKDEEINKYSTQVSRLRGQIEELESEIKCFKDERDNQLQEISRLEAENETSKEEAKEVLQALEELAMNFDQKEAEILAKTKELDEVLETLNFKETQLVEKENEYQSVKESVTSQKKKYSEIFSSLFKEIIEVGSQLNDQIPVPTLVSNEKLDEEATMMRLYIKKLKNEARSCHMKAKELEEEKNVHIATLTKIEEETKHYKSKVQEYEGKIANLNEKLEETEVRRRTFLDTIDQLNSDIVRLRATEQLMTSQNAGQNAAIIQGQEIIQTKLDIELKRQNEAHVLQVKELRDELANKDKELQTHIDRLNHLEVHSKSLADELKKQSEQLENTKAKMAALEIADEKKEQSRLEIIAVQETVDKELSSLNDIKSDLIQILHKRLAKMNNRQNAKRGMFGDTNLEPSSTAVPSSTTTTEGQQQPDSTASIASVTFDDLANEDEIETCGSAAQRTKIAYLESNLMRLTKMHKALVANKGDLKLDLMKLEKRHKSAMDRITMLETALKEAKDSALKDRKRYNHEIERIRDMMRVRAPTHRRKPQITIPIRGGGIVNQPTAVIRGGQ